MSKPLHKEEMEERLGFLWAGEQDHGCTLTNKNIMVQPWDHLLDRPDAQEEKEEPHQDVEDALEGLRLEAPSYPRAPSKDRYSRAMSLFLWCPAEGLVRP